MMSTFLITYIALVGQLLLISYYYPQKILNRIGHVLENFPSTTHPKLYPTNNAEDMARSWVKKFKLITRSTLIFGFVLLFSAYVTDTEIKDVMVFGFFMLQAVPFIILEVSELKHYKLMRKANTGKKRSADLRPRRYFDYISPLKFSFALLALTLYICFNLYRNDFQLSITGNGIITLVTIIGVHIYFAIIVIWLMRGKRINPHMENKDRETHIQSVVNTTCYTSIGISLFLLAHGLLQHYALDQWEPLAISLYFQMIIILGPGTMLKANRLKDINFDVYRQDAKTT